MAPQKSITTQSCRRRAIFAFWFYSLQQILVNNNHTCSKLLIRCSSKNHMPIVPPESLQSSFLPESKPHKSHHINLQLEKPLKFFSHFIKASAKRKPIILLSATMTSLLLSPHWGKKNDSSIDTLESLITSRAWLVKSQLGLSQHMFIFNPVLFLT